MFCSRQKFLSRLSLVLLGGLALSSPLGAQSSSPTLAKEYIRFNGQVVAFETPACQYSLSSASQSFSASAQSGTVTVTTTSGCAWTVSSNAGWLTITSGSTGSGNGTVGFSLAANGS
jgi:hypothetical protein